MNRGSIARVKKNDSVGCSIYSGMLVRINKIGIHLGLFCATTILKKEDREKIEYYHPEIPKRLLKAINILDNE